MNALLLADYENYNERNFGFYQQKRALIAVSGKEAVQFLNGLVTNDAAKLEDGAQMRAAFPNAQGRLLAIVRVSRIGDKFFFETENATRDKIFQNLFRFTFAGDFFVEDLSDDYDYFSIFGDSTNFAPETDGLIVFGNDYFVPKAAAENFKNELQKNIAKNNAVEISDALYEVLRIENGVPIYGVDADETTIVSELGISDLISYKKGCYIGQEIIARIHFRGHVAKQLTGLILEESAAPNDELKSSDGKNAGKITSVIFSPKLNKYIALAFVRYDYLAEGTGLKVNETEAIVKNLPFV